MGWKTLSFIFSSEKREKVIISLAYPTTPTRITKKIGISKPHVSRVLKRFMGMGVVECKTPDKRKGKIYVLTDKGKRVLKEMKKM